MLSSHISHSLTDDFFHRTGAYGFSQPEDDMSTPTIAECFDLLAILGFLIFVVPAQSPSKLVDKGRIKDVPNLTWKAFLNGDEIPFTGDFEKVAENAIKLALQSV